MTSTINLINIPSPTGSGGPMLLPGIREPDQPLSMGLNLRRRNLVMESLNLISLSILKRNTIFKKKMSKLQLII